MFYWEGGRKTGALLFGAGLIWGHYLYFQRLWAHSKPHPLSSPKLGEVPEGRRGLFIRVADGLSIMFTGHHIKPKSVH